MAQLSNSQTLVLNQLTRLLNDVPDTSHIIGPLDINRDLLRMPRSSNDGRDLTWTKFVRLVAVNVTNTIRDPVEDCWFVQAMAGEEFRVVKMDPHGGRNKWKFQTCTYVLKNYANARITSHTLFDSNSDTLSHLCSASFPRLYACVNPHHLRYEDSATNEDRKGCRYGCAYLCPHSGLCKFTNKENGRSRPCFNNSNRFVDCVAEHDGSCVGLSAFTRDDMVDHVPGSSTNATSSVTTHAGLGRDALLSETRDVVDEARARGEFGLPRRH